MRDLAAAALRCPPDRVRLGRAPSGRPFVADPSSVPLDVNASHAGAWIAAAVAPDARVGVDLEPVRPVSGELVARCLSVDERAGLATLPAERAASRFFQLWTAKEAYLKAIGRGLAVDPRTVEVAFADGRPVLRNADGWNLRSWEPAPGVWLAVCTDGEPPERVEFREAGRA